ncbi:RYamide receptor-like [Paramacrobiotus metropolitanus]|uniref:RYamide receptor-like n=1 Tax=Paramacrobiotus metropolitanus TaxID=2943436 RepID=UPI002445F281|nr:RYamide receptor-like [Paramacrobiotus metropolitanus]XP_055343292.1 RYamide receptor-like [Paramacrobiotus metropolitanus]XP_055343293.1 RYamide receptor-like [Paramacrobiotus metropolitanus]
MENSATIASNLLSNDAHLSTDSERLPGHSFDFTGPTIQANISGSLVTWNLTTTFTGANMSQLGDPLCEMPKIPPPEDQQAFFIFSYGLITLVAIAGNAIVCYIILAFEKMRRTENIFIFNLALADIVLACFCVPFSFVPNIIVGYWPFGLIMCKLVNTSQIVSVLVSSYILVAISVERYVGVFYPFRPKMTFKQVLIVVFLTWFGSFAISLPVVIYMGMFEQPLPDGIFLPLCRENWPVTEDSYKYGVVLLVLQYFLPIAIMGLSYSRIACHVWKMKPPGEALKDRDKKFKDEKTRMTKMMVVVVLLYVISWLPLNVYIVLSEQYGNTMGCYRYIHFVWFACHWLAMSHATYNPIIYFWMNYKFRAGFVYALNLVFCFRRKSDQWLVDNKLIDNRYISGQSSASGMKYTEVLSKFDCAVHTGYSSGRSSITAVAGKNPTATNNLKIVHNNLARLPGNKAEHNRANSNGYMPVKCSVAVPAVARSPPRSASVTSAGDTVSDTTEARILLPDHPIADL